MLHKNIPPSYPPPKDFRYNYLIEIVWTFPYVYVISYHKQVTGKSIILIRQHLHVLGFSGMPIKWYFTTSRALLLGWCTFCLHLQTLPIILYITLHFTYFTKINKIFWLRSRRKKKSNFLSVATEKVTTHSSLSQLRLESLDLSSRNEVGYIGKQKRLKRSWWLVCWSFRVAC